MQHIPHHSLEDLESSRADMEAFRKNLEKEKHVWPDLTLTGEDIHRAFCIAMPDEARPWDAISLVAQQKYEAMAKELNRELDARQAWFEGDDIVTIEAARCPQCREMLLVEHAENHACWITVR
jgi:hypothetical protein